jgi:hypothetical protein
VSLDYCDAFLVALTKMELFPRGEELLTRFEPFLVERRETNEYPAGSLPWGTITVQTYRLERASLDLLLGAADRLFDWQEPELPNDLCLMRDDHAWLTTMASDGEAVLTLEEAELMDLSQRLPALRLVAITAG